MDNKERKIIGYKLIEDYPFRKDKFSEFVRIGETGTYQFDEFAKFPKNWQPVYEQAPVTQEQISECIGDILGHINNIKSVTGDYIWINKNEFSAIIFNRISKLLAFLFFLISFSALSQDAHQDSLRAIENFNEFQYYKTIGTVHIAGAALLAIPISVLEQKENRNIKGNRWRYTLYAVDFGMIYAAWRNFMNAHKLKMKIQNEKY